MHSLCVVRLHVTVNYTKILNVAQQCFLWKIYVAGNNKNVRRSSCKVPDAALKQKNVLSFMALFRCVISLNRS